MAHFRLFRDVIIILTCLMSIAKIYTEPSRSTVDNGKYILDLYKHLGD